MGDPTLSVCLITYNHAEYIRQAIESVLMQQVNFSWELIIADDYSTDGTRDILVEYQKRYPDRIKLILQSRNVGPAQNWLDLITTPTTQYIAYSEGDDYWIDPFKLQKQVDFLETNMNFCWCIHAAEILDILTGGSTQFEGVKPMQGFATKDIIARGGGFYHTSSLVFRTSAIREIPEFFLRIWSGDWAWILLISLYGNGIFLPDRMSVYRLHKGGVSSSIANDNLARIKLLKSNLLLLREFNRYTSYKYFISIFTKSVSIYKKMARRYIRYLLNKLI